MKTDGTTPIVSVHWTEKILLYRRLQGVDLYFFLNYKKGFSIVLPALCEASYQFTVVYIAEEGRQSDGRFFANNGLNHSIVNDYFNLLQPKKLYSESEILFPHGFVEDDAFLMRHNLLKPYSSSSLERVLLIFNNRLSRTKRIIENTFGILAARFGIFRRSILFCLETVENIANACVTLHNYLMANNCFGETNSYCLNGFIDQEIRPNG